MLAAIRATVTAALGMANASTAFSKNVEVVITLFKPVVSSQLRLNATYVSKIIVAAGLAHALGVDAENVYIDSINSGRRLRQLAELTQLILFYSVEFPNDSDDAARVLGLIRGSSDANIDTVTLGFEAALGAQLELLGHPPFASLTSVSDNAKVFTEVEYTVIATGHSSGDASADTSLAGSVATALGPAGGESGADQGLLAQLGLLAVNVS
eukprot:COSAG05_NODE_2745_length_2693_cov_1.756361_3_plen_210_part_01